MTANYQNENDWNSSRKNFSHKSKIDHCSINIHTNSDFGSKRTMYIVQMKFFWLLISKHHFHAMPTFDSIRWEFFPHLKNKIHLKIHKKLFFNFTSTSNRFLHSKTIYCHKIFITKMFLFFFPFLVHLIAL